MLLLLLLFLLVVVVVVVVVVVIVVVFVVIVVVIVVSCLGILESMNTLRASNNCSVKNSLNIEFKNFWELQLEARSTYMKW